MTPEQIQATVGYISEKHQDGFSVTEIAEDLKVPEATVCYAVHHGTFPNPQPMWLPYV